MYEFRTMPMAPAALLSLRDRLPPPAAPRPPEAGRGRGEARRVLDLATNLFGVEVAALVLAMPEGLSVAAVSGAEEVDGAVAAACHLFEVLAASASSAEEGPAGVLEEIAAGRGFVAVTPVLSAAGRCRGALCLLDPDRRAFLTGMQRHLFAEFGGLLASALGRDEAVPAGCAAA